MIRIKINQRSYRYIFWSGYFAVLITAFLPVGKGLEKVSFGTGLFHIRLDHLLHFSVYFIICLGYLLGLALKINLFDTNPFRKFFLLILLLATVTEGVQIWVPWRAFSLLDWLSNVSGLLVGSGIVFMVQKLRWLTE